jgi:hypothetical protein
MGLTTADDDGQTIREWRARTGRRRMTNGDDMKMPRASFCLKAAIVTVALSGPAVAQTVTSPATRPAASPASAKTPLSTRVETWTKAHWEAAKKEWAKDTTKWANCQKQWNKHKHEGRKSWPSVYQCMTG